MAITTWSPAGIDLCRWYVYKLHMIRWIFIACANLNNSLHEFLFLSNNMGWSLQVVCMTHRTYPWVAPVHFHPNFYFQIWIFFTARKRFAVHVPCDDEPLRPSPVRLFPQRNEAVATCESNDSGVAAPPQAPETTCAFCPRAPCITTSDFKPNGRCDARMTNYSKRRKDYEWYWRTLKDNGLWDNPMYLEKKQQLGCLIDDVREVTPHCVIKDVRDRWPNPSNVPYQRHRRSWKLSDITKGCSVSCA